MSSCGLRNRASKDLSGQSGHSIHRVKILVLLALVLLAAVIVPTILYLHAQGSVAASEKSAHDVQAQSAPLQTQYADRFMQSIVTDDGALGWRQLCPNIQAQLPMNELVQQANEQRAALQQNSIRLSKQFISTAPRQGGGWVHTYIVTAHWPDNSMQQRTYTVYTQSSGCVDDVQNR